jgi:hypothetical protein
LRFIRASHVPLARGTARFDEGAMDSNDRQRKDRLIQTRVPQNLESTLKDEARKRRLSVSHLIRNVLEDTFNLVDNVVTEVDRVVADSVGMAQTLKRDAQRLAATARGQIAHRAVSGEGKAEPPPASPGGQAGVSSAPSANAEGPSAEDVAGPDPAALAHVYGFQELVLNRPAVCASCGVAIARGMHAFLGMSDAPGPRIWVCHDCVDALPG